MSHTGYACFWYEQRSPVECMSSIQGLTRRSLLINRKLGLLFDPYGNNAAEFFFA